MVTWAAAWMDQEIIILGEVSQTETNTIRNHLYVESKKKIQMNLYTKQKQTHRHRKQPYGYQTGRRGDKLGIWDYRGKLLYIKQISNRELYSTTSNNL